MLFHVVNLGCKVNKVESDSYAAQCLSAGLAEGALEAADLIVVNTCAVTGEAEKKTRKTVRHVCNKNDHAKVLVTGCSAALHADIYQEMSPRIVVLGKAFTAEYLSDLLRSDSENKNGSLQEDAQSVAAVPVLPVGEGFRTRVGIKVQDGCNNECTYCIVHVARGKATSRPTQEIIDEVRAYSALGVKELVLTGINLGSYHQIYQGKPIDLAGLLTLLLQESENVECTQMNAQCGNAELAPAPRFRIGSVEPMDVTDELIDVMARANGRICRHLHLPLQSGSTDILAEMNRPYTASDFLGLVDKLRASIPSISLSTDIIVGFPGETDNDFLQTCSVAQACCFSKIHVFPYSKREGTPAAQRADQIAPSIKTERAARLRNLGDKLAHRDFESRSGSTEWALVESNGTAMTESYYSVSCDKAWKPGLLIPFLF